MRKYLGTVVALEANHGEEISMEEAEQMTADAAQDATEVEATLADTNEGIDKVDALEDLAVIADGIDTPSDTEMALIANTENALTIGENMPEGTLIPEVAGIATEGFVGRKISTESIREKAATIWENIQKFLKQVWEKIESFFYRLFGTIPSLRKNVAAMEKRIEAESNKRLEDKKFKVHTGVAMLSVNYVPCKNEADLKTSLNQFDGMVKEVYTTIVDNSVKMGDTIATALSNFDPATASDSLVKLNDKIEGYLGQKAFTVDGGVNKSRFPGYESRFSKPMLGNIALCLKTPETKNTESAAAHATYLRNSGVFVVSSSETTKEGPKDFEMSTLSHSSMRDMLSTCGNMLDVLEEYKRGKRTKDLEKTNRELKAAGGKAATKIESSKTGDEADRGAIDTYRSMANYNHAFAHWVSQPAMPIYSQTLSVVRAILVVCQKSCACYK
jgi:hypothetical protein